MAGIMERVDALVLPPFAAGLLLVTNATGHPTLVLPTSSDGRTRGGDISFIGRLFDEHLIRLGRSVEAAMTPAACDRRRLNRSRSMGSSTTRPLRLPVTDRATASSHRAPRRPGERAPAAGPIGLAAVRGRTTADAGDPTIVLVHGFSVDGSTMLNWAGPGGKPPRGRPGLPASANTGRRPPGHRASAGNRALLSRPSTISSTACGSNGRSSSVRAWAVRSSRIRRHARIESRDSCSSVPRASNRRSIRRSRRGQARRAHAEGRRPRELRPRLRPQLREAAMDARLDEVGDRTRIRARAVEYEAVLRSLEPVLLGTPKDYVHQCPTEIVWGAGIASSIRRPALGGRDRGRPS